MHAVWLAVCKQCGLMCAVRGVGKPYALRDLDLLLDAHWALPLHRLHDLPHRLVFYYWDPGKMGRYFHFNGNLLVSVGATASLVAQAQREPETALGVRVNQELRSSGGFIYSWRRALTHLGFSKPATAKLLNGVVAKFEANFTRDLVAHMMAYRSG